METALRGFRLHGVLCVVKAECSGQLEQGALGESGLAHPWQTRVVVIAILKQYKINEMFAPGALRYGIQLCLGTCCNDLAIAELP